LNYILPRKMQNEMEDKLSKMGFPEGKDAEEKVYKEAPRCYKALSVFLGGKPFFFGDHPSSLDAIVFGHLSVHLSAQMPNNTLAKLVKEHSNLVNFVDSITKNFFRDSQQSTFTPHYAPNKNTTSQESPAPSTSTPSPEKLTPQELRERRKSILWMVGAATLMLAYVGGQYGWARFA